MPGPPVALFGWLVLGRQALLLALGTSVVLDAVITPGTHNVEIGDGLILLGIVPLDAFLSRLPLPRRSTMTAPTPGQPQPADPQPQPAQPQPGSEPVKPLPYEPAPPQPDPQPYSDPEPSEQNE